MRGHATDPGHLGWEGADCRLAVDAYVWLHKGAFGCAEELVKGRKTTKFVDYAMYRVRMLRHYGVEPYVVFDGGPLPAKRGTEDSRARWVIASCLLCKDRVRVGSYMPLAHATDRAPTISHAPRALKRKDGGKTPAMPTPNASTSHLKWRSSSSR